MRYAQLPADLAGSHTGSGQLDDSQSNGMWQWPAIDENAAQLVLSTLSCVEMKMVFLINSVY